MARCNWQTRRIRPAEGSCGGARGAAGGRGEWRRSFDTSDDHGPDVTKRTIREALQPCPDNLTIVTKIGARRGPDGSWNPAFSREELTRRCMTTCAIRYRRIEVVNLRAMFNPHYPTEGSLEVPLAVVADLQRQGLVRHIGSAMSC